MEGGENDHFGGTIWGSDVALLRVTDSSPMLTVATSGKDLSFQHHKHESGVPMVGSEVVSTGDSVGFHNEVPIADCSPTGKTAILPPIPTMGRCVSHDLWGPEGGGGVGGTTLAHRCGFDPGSSVVLPITTQTRPVCPQVDSALGFTSVCARPVDQGPGVWRRVHGWWLAVGRHQRGLVSLLLFRSKHFPVFRQLQPIISCHHRGTSPSWFQNHSDCFI